jgi:hypothetical protein
MTKQYELSTGICAAALVLATALPVAALSVSDVTAIAGQARVDLGTSAAGSSTDNSANAQVNVGLTGNASGSENGTNASGSAQGSGSVTLAPIVMTRADADANASAAGTNTPVAGDVNSDGELSSFIGAQIRGDKNVDQIQATPDTVAVTYREHAKLFGLIPVVVDTTAIVNADGTITVSYPWYGFLLSTNNDLKAKVQDRVQTALNAHASANANASANAGVNLTASERAQLISEVRAAMAETLSVNANASADASGSANVQ